MGNWLRHAAQCIWLTVISYVGLCDTVVGGTFQSNGHPLDWWGVGYNAASGEVWFNAFCTLRFTSLNVYSDADVFTGEPAMNLDGPFDAESDGHIFKGAFPSSLAFGTLSFGTIAQPGLSEEFVRADLSAVGTGKHGGDVGDPGLTYVSTPPLASGGLLGDDAASVIYDARSASLSVEAIGIREDAWLGMFSSSGIFDDEPASSINSCPAINSGMAHFTTVAENGTHKFGTIVPSHLTEAFLLDDLSIVESGVGNVDLVYIPVPEPNTLALLTIGLTGFLLGRQQRLARIIHQPPRASVRFMQTSNGTGR